MSLSNSLVSTFFEMSRLQIWTQYTELEANPIKVYKCSFILVLNPIRHSFTRWFIHIHTLTNVIREKIADQLAAPIGAVTELGTLSL
jgi:hypothetical protein